MYEAIARFYGARDGRKSTMYTYLCQPDGSIFSFSARCVNAVPKMTVVVKASHKDFISGTPK
ncbi:MAG: hypothetical protein IJ858_00775 [Acidaminococcaceae bacterium]|nr:hypothetical protein [Acidaminococcaceae bacterium]